MDVDEVDDATREILLKARVHPELGTRLQCVGTVDGAACNDQLYQCPQCRRVGCRAASCTMQVIDENVCRHCGHGFGMNRNVKITAVRLFQLWEKLHSDRARSS